MTREEIKNSREYMISKAAVDYYHNHKNADIVSTFEDACEWADNNPIHYDGQAMLYVLHKGVKQGKKEMLNNVIEWLGDNLYEYLKINRDFNEADFDSKRLFDDLKKAMEEKLVDNE